MYFRASEAFILLFLSILQPARKKISSKTWFIQLLPKQKLHVAQHLTAISNRQRQHLACIVSMVKDAPTGHKYYEDSLSARKIQRYRKDHSESSIRYRYRCRYCIRISVHESTAGSTEIPKYRISFGIPSSVNVCNALKDPEFRVVLWLCPT